MESINQEAQAAIKTGWNSFASSYDQYMHLFMLQAFTTLIVHSRVHTKKRILEVACGSGMHSLYLAKTMLQRGSALVCTDISDEMIRLMKDKFDDPESDYTVIPGNKYDIKDEELIPLGQQTFDLEERIKISSKDRFVLGCLANNECLPFKDGTFDCYISNLSLMIVTNHKNMLAEALRVSQQGATLAFTVWGRKQNMQIFEVLDTVLIKHDLKPNTPPKKTNYDLGKDPEGLKAEMLALGFANIRMWYQPMNFNFLDA